VPIAAANGIEICFETFGDPSDPALLLVCGFGAQLISWPEGMCRALAAGGRYVIRFDNRDVGLSTHLDGVTVDIGAVLAAAAGDGEMPPVPYTLSTMSDDAFGLLSALNIDRAHIVGASMGGMIVQTMAIEHPERVLSMTSVMSTSGESAYFRSAPEAGAALMAPVPAEREANIAQSAERARLWSSKRWFDHAAAVRLATQSFDRAFYPEGMARQMAAIRASGHRAEGLRNLRVPSLVIHGRDDTLITPAGGERTAELVPGASLLMLGDMGHDRPEPLWPVICDAILSHTRHAVR
jgi:pimeloyl-ACP methyl ester carboxylesterase